MNAIPFSQEASFLDKQALSIICSNSHIAETLAEKVQLLNVQTDPSAPYCLMIDQPTGFALQCLEDRSTHQRPTLVATVNTCPDYWALLWEYNVAGIMGYHLIEHELVTAMQRMTTNQSYHSALLDGPPKLTSTERRILYMVACGWSNQDIAEQLVTSLQSIKNHMKSVLTKLQVNNRTEAALYLWDIQPGCNNDTISYER
ncbi:MAG: LuxR C-terminal-related transcriptional regulator [Chloroflexota bacterium]